AAALAAVRKISNHTVYHVPLHLQRAALFALEHTCDFGARAFAAHRAAREVAVDTVTAKFFPPEGASYLFLDLRERLPAGATDCLPILERALDAGVLLTPGEAFGRGFEGHARLC